MDIYLVNLDKNCKRLDFMVEQMTRLELPFVRESAICGESLTEEEIGRSFRSLRSEIAIGRRLFPGEIGCALSHINIYRKIRDVCCILEDDVSISDNLSDALIEIERFVDVSKKQVVMLSSHAAKSKLANGQGIERVSEAMCTDGYVITKPAADMIISANYPVVSQADSWKRWHDNYGLEIYRYWPTVIRQRNDVFLSDIAAPVVASEHKGLVMKIMHRIKRCVELPIDKLLLKIVET